MSFGIYTAYSSLLCAGSAGMATDWSLELAEHAEALNTYTRQQPESAPAAGLNLIYRATLASDTATTNSLLGRAMPNFLHYTEGEGIRSLEDSDFLLLASALLLITKLVTRKKQVVASADDLVMASARIALEANRVARGLSGSELFGVDAAITRVQAHAIEAAKIDLPYPQRRAVAEATQRLSVARGSQEWERRGFALPLAEAALDGIYSNLDVAEMRRAPLYVVPSDHLYIGFEVSHLAEVGLQRALGLFLEGSIDPAIETVEALIDKAEDAELFFDAIASYSDILRRARGNTTSPSQTLADLLAIPLKPSGDRGLVLAMPARAIALEERLRVTPSVAEFITYARGVQNGFEGIH